MKIIWRILALFKFFFLPPLAALGIWILTSFTATFVRLIPWLIKYLMKWTASPEINQAYSYIMQTIIWLLALLNRLVYGLNGWLPVALIINCFVFYQHFKFTMWFHRMYVRAITLGKV